MDRDITTKFPVISTIILLVNTLSDNTINVRTWLQITHVPTLTVGEKIIEFLLIS